MSIKSVSKSLIIFQINKQKSQWVVWHVKEMKINEKNEHQKLSNRECTAKTIGNGCFCCFQCKLGLANTQSKLIKKGLKEIFSIYFIHYHLSHMSFYSFCFFFFFFGKLLKMGVNKKTRENHADTRFYVQPTSSRQLANNGAHLGFRAHTRFF
jgi:hypothetical protein